MGQTLAEYCRAGRQRSGCPVCAGSISPAQKMRYEVILSAVLDEKSKMGVKK